jgi:hypothetical protein
MNESILGLIADAVSDARAQGLDGTEGLDACAAVLARETGLAPRIARVLVEQLAPLADPEVASA